MALFQKPPAQSAAPTTTLPAELTTALASMATGIAKMQTIMEQGFSKVAQNTTPKPDPEPEAEAETEVTDEQIDRMTGSQLTKHLLSQVGKVVEAAVKPIGERVASTQASATTTEVRTRFDAFKRDNKGAEILMPEMREVLKKHPSMMDDFPALLREAKAIANPDRLKEYEAVAVPPKEQTGNVHPFGGMHPRTRSVTSEETTQERMTPQQAAEAAFEELFGEGADVVGGPG